MGLTSTPLTSESETFNPVHYGHLYIEVDRRCTDMVKTCTEIWRIAAHPNMRRLSSKPTLRLSAAAPPGPLIILLFSTARRPKNGMTSSNRPYATNLSDMGNLLGSNDSVTTSDRSSLIPTYQHHPSVSRPSWEHDR